MRKGKPLMVSSRLDNIDQFVVETVFEDNGAVKGFTILEEKQRQVINNNKAVATSNKAVAASGFELGKAFRRIGGYLVFKDVMESIIAVDALSASFTALAGSAELGADEIRFLREESERLGLNYLQTAGSYKNLFAAGIGAGLDRDFVRSIFSNLMQAGTALQLDPRAVKGALLAVEQMISKGKVSLEELRRQLGNALPGAMQIAAKAMGVTSKQFEQMISDGMDSVEFLKKFNAQLGRDFGDKWQVGSKSLRAETNRLKNAILDLKTAFAEGGGMSAIISMFQLLTKVVKVSSSAVGFFIQHIDKFSIAIAAVLIPSIVKAIPLLHLFVLNLKAGMGLFASIKFALVAAAPAMKGFALSAWALVSPFLKLYIVLELVINAIKVLKGEANLFEKIGEAVANFWHHGSFDDETYEDRMERLKIWNKDDLIKKPMGANPMDTYMNYKNSTVNPMDVSKSPIDYAINKQIVPDVPPAAPIISPQQISNNSTSENKNITQNVTFNINGAQSPQAIADEIERIVSDKLALGVMG